MAPPQKVRERLATVNDSEAAALVRIVLYKLAELGARDVIAGIDESRRMGIEEPVDKTPKADRLGSKSELKQVGTIRRRPPTNLELLRMTFEQLRQRLLVVPAIAGLLRKELRDSEVVWRVEREFLPSDQLSAPDARLSDLIPDGTGDVLAAYER